MNFPLFLYTPIMPNLSLQLVDEFASGYDSYIQNCGWQGPEMLFGMMYEYLSGGERIIDIGIGTGLNSVLFHKAGLDVYGVDGSDRMLELCKAKNIAKELKKADLTKGKLPFINTFHHATSFAVLHFLCDLDLLFSSLSDNFLPGGAFGFSVDLYKQEKDVDYTASPIQGVFQKVQPESGLIIYKHSWQYITHILVSHHFEIKKNTEILAFKDPASGRTVYFQLIIAIRK